MAWIATAMAGLAKGLNSYSALPPTELAAHPERIALSRRSATDPIAVASDRQRLACKPTLAPRVKPLIYCRHYGSGVPNPVRRSAGGISQACKLHQRFSKETPCNELFLKLTPA